MLPLYTHINALLVRPMLPLYTHINALLVRPMLPLRINALLVGAEVESLLQMRRASYSNMR